MESVNDLTKLGLELPGLSDPDCPVAISSDASELSASSEQSIEAEDLELDTPLICQPSIRSRMPEVITIGVEIETVIQPVDDMRVRGLDSIFFKVRDSLQKLQGMLDIGADVFLNHAGTSPNRSRFLVMKDNR